MFNTIFDTSASGLDIKTALIAAGAALLLGVALAITHQKTSQTTKGFLITLATLPLLVMAVMIMINGNLGTSIAILGHDDRPGVWNGAHSFWHSNNNHSHPCYHFIHLYTLFGTR